MTCPICGGVSIRVIDSRPVYGGAVVWRRRMCAAGHRWTTHEQAERDVSKLRGLLLQAARLVRRVRQVRP